MKCFQSFPLTKDVDASTVSMFFEESASGPNVQNADMNHITEMCSISEYSIL